MNIENSIFDYDHGPKIGPRKPPTRAYSPEQAADMENAIIRLTGADKEEVRPKIQIKKKKPKDIHIRHRDIVRFVRERGEATRQQMKDLHDKTDRTSECDIMFLIRSGFIEKYRRDGLTFYYRAVKNPKQTLK